MVKDDLLSAFLFTASKLGFTTKNVKSQVSPLLFYHIFFLLKWQERQKLKWPILLKMGHFNF